jgi:hypothetical protein
MMVYDTTLNNLFIWTGSAWESVPASGDAGANGAVQYNDNGAVTGATGFLYNKTTGEVSIPDNLTVTNGKGLNFAATPQPAGMTSELLNDYEEGTWVPVVADAVSGGNAGTCTINSAKYSKVGRLVSVQCDISAITTTGMTAGNAFTIRGLPYTPVGASIGNFYTFRVGRSVVTVSSSVYAYDNIPAVQFFLFSTNSATSDVRIVVSDIVSTTSQIIFSVVYSV